MLVIMSFPTIALARPLTALDLDQIQTHHDVSSAAQESLQNPLSSTMKRRRLLQDASQSSKASATAQGGVITSSSASQVVSDGNGNIKVAGKAESVVNGAVSSQTQASTQGYVSLKTETDGSVEYIVNSASAAAAQDSSTPSVPSQASASVTGESTVSDDIPDAKATHEASASGTLTASEGINTVIISQNKPIGA